MDLCTAVKKAQKIGKGIYRKSDYHSGVVILPTNRSTCCMMISRDEDKRAFSDVGYRWNPKLDDLVATDWMVEK